MENLAFGISDREYEKQQKEQEEQELNKHCKFITGGSEINFTQLQRIAARRMITHVMPIPLLENCAACQSVSFLTRDAEGYVYEDLNLEPISEVGADWVKLDQPVQAEADKYCWQSDGGSIWLALYNDAYYDPSMKLVVRGPKGDTQFMDTIGQEKYQQFFYNKKLQQVVEVAA